MIPSVVIASFGFSAGWLLDWDFTTVNSVKNSDVASRLRRPGFGPIAGSGSSTARLSTSRAALLAVLRDQAEPVTMAALATLSGLHVNTVREHLEALTRLRLVQRHASAPNGRGRPAWLYLATGAEGAPSEYAGLAAALAATIHRTSDTPTEDAAEAGEDWGRRLADERGARPGKDPETARRKVVELLDELGFGADANPGNTVVRLTRCPLLAAAHQYPDVVCGVHLGLVRGALTACGAETRGTDLVPFAEPGACLLRLGSA